MTSILQNKYFKKTVSAVFWILLWQLAAVKVGKELILPGPLAVFEHLLALIVTASFWQNVLATLLRIITGYAIGVIMAVILAVATCSSRLLDTLLSPVIRIVRTTPVASFIILALLWMGKTMVPALITVLMVIPVVWENICAQYAAADRSLLEMARAYRFSNWKIFRYIYVPSAMPGFLSGCVTSMGLAWKSGIAAEVLAQPSKAIGSNLYYSKLYLETADLFAWTMVVVVLSLCIEKVIRKIIEGGKNNESK
ncbi:MAG: ABC transporter permease subunit [Erysipelotrichaceae bacterium]|nr:ABC transporter permease subunit [Erysipelotrichaceae bacterium]